jgi:signal transduction histidine kinase
MHHTRGLVTLAEFILHDMEAILAEWEAFAATLLPGAASMTPLELRDHAQQILEAVAADLTIPQTAEEQAEKSRGRAPAVAGAPETAAQTHAVLRARSGFDINQLVAEYRALRATVLRLWLHSSQLEPADPQDVIRFDEAIDQAIAESVGHFSTQVEQARNLFLGMLGHDMRNPLNNILMTAQYLSVLNAGDKVSLAADRLIRSGASMQALLDDLVDFNRSTLGIGLKIAASDTDLGERLGDELEQLRGAHPDRLVELFVCGDLHGCWDAPRLQQVLRNLVLNAIRHGAPGTPVRVVLRGDEDDVTVEVINSGPAIEEAVLNQIFEPLRRGLAGVDQDGRGGLGLGLFIVREIARAHGAEVAVRSADGETAFTLRLPRHVPEFAGAT